MAMISCARGCGAYWSNTDGSDLPAIWVCGPCSAKMPAKAVGGADYGPTCEARFAMPIRVCKLPPGHAGDHDAMVRGSEEVKRLDLLDESIEVIHWARSRPGVMSLLRALKERGYDETGTEYLRRVVDGRGASGERSVPPTVGGMAPIDPPHLPMPFYGGRVEHMKDGSVDYSQRVEVPAGMIPPEEDGEERLSASEMADLTAPLEITRKDGTVFVCIDNRPPASVEPARPGSMGTISHEPGCPCSECSAVDGRGS